VFFIVNLDGKVIGSARGIIPPSCGDYGEERAILVIIVSPRYKDLGLETRLLNMTCKELNSQDVKWIEMGIMDSWKDQQVFLEENGFKPHEPGYDVVLPIGVPIQEHTPSTNVRIRPIQLSEDGEKVIALYRGERAKDLPKECDLETPWWELEPYASILDPEGFLVAEDGDTGEIVGFIDAWFHEEDSQGKIGDLDVVGKHLGTGLRRSLVSLAVIWLRKKGVKNIRTRVHVGYRNTEELFRRLGFEVENRYSVWRRRTLV
jgi:GNAT superfamily N-acetyltransferase